MITQNHDSKLVAVAEILNENLCKKRIKGDKIEIAHVLGDAKEALTTLGMNPTLATKVLHIMEQSGYVSRAGSGTYRI